MKVMLKEIIHRKELLSRLEEFVYMAEKGNPLDDSFPPFPESRYGRLLNRLVNTYRRDMNDRDTLSAAREMVARESQDNIRQKKQLTQNISHELKTPVSSINGYLETLVNNPNMSSQQRDIFLRKCYEQSQRLSSLLLDLSTITRMDEAPAALQPPARPLDHHPHGRGRGQDREGAYLPLRRGG